MRLYITGANGFIGNYLMNFFLNKKGIKVTGISHGQNKQTKDIIFTDYKDEAWLASKLNKETDLYVIHTAAYIPDKPNYLNKATLLVNKNIDNFISRVFKNSDVKKFIYFSSIAVYGYGYQDLISITEETDLLIKDYYAASKLYGENLVLETFNGRGFILRLSSPYGVNKKRKNILEKMFEKVYKHENIEIYQEGKRIQDFIYIEDIAKVIINLLCNMIDAGIYNLASGYKCQMNYLALALINILESNSKINKIDIPEGFSTTVDNTKLKKAVNLNFLEVLEGIRKMKDEYIRKGLML